MPTTHDLLPLTPLSHAVLLALAEGELHGYAILQEVERLTDGAVRPGTGTLYAALQRMLSEGVIEDGGRTPGPEEDQRRRYYGITSLGREVARAEARRLERVLEVAREKRLAPAAAQPSGRGRGRA